MLLVKGAASCAVLKKFHEAEPGCMPVLYEAVLLTYRGLMLGGA
jgi:hypothetical protein